MNKFWNRTTGHNRVTHREIGDIPGILKACDVFVAVSLEEMQKATNERAEQFCNLIKFWNTGRDASGMPYGHREFMNDRFHRGDAKLSVIANPSKPYNKAL